MSTPVRIIAIDPGYDRVGWAVGSCGSSLKVEAFGLIQTSSKDPLIKRYQDIDTQLSEIMKQWQPHEGAVESLFFTKNQTTAMHVAEARGVIISCFFRHHVAFAEYTPLQIKQAVTGFGRADKKAVEKMVRLQLGTALAQNSEKIIDDTLDALGLLITHAACRNVMKL